MSDTIKEVKAAVKRLSWKLIGTILTCTRDSVTIGSFDIKEMHPSWHDFILSYGMRQFSPDKIVKCDTDEARKECLVKRFQMFREEMPAEPEKVQKVKADDVVTMAMRLPSHEARLMMLDMLNRQGSLKPGQYDACVAESLAM